MKLILKSLVLLFSFVLLLALLILIQTINPEQTDPNTQTFVFPDSLRQGTFKLDSLQQLVGINKGLPEGFEEAALLAYSAYPQLKEVSIDMILTQDGAPMESNFELITLLGPKKWRKYRILLNNGINTPYDEILLRNLPFDAQVGILAHELGHVAYYHDLSTLEIAKWGLNYLLDDNFRASHERTTDLMPVYHGLGHQIYHYAYYVRYDSCCQELYEEWGDFMDTFYLTDQEIANAISQHPLYSN